MNEPGIGHTCCFNSILSLGDFLVKLDKNDRGKTKAALPTKTRPNRIELTPIDVPGLTEKEKENSNKNGHPTKDGHGFTHCI